MPLPDTRGFPIAERCGPKALLALLVCLLLLNTGLAGESFFGERPPGAKPKPFAINILSAEYHPHSSLTFSLDGTELCWSAFIGEGPEETILCSQYDGEALGEPEVALFPAGRDGAGPAFSIDGRRVFFKTSRRLYGPRRSSGIAVVKRMQSGWSHPLIFASTFDSTRHSGQPSVARSGNLYFSGRDKKERFPRIYIVRFEDGEYGDPEPLALDCPGALDPFVDPDERFLIFGAIGLQGGFGFTDLCISHRMADGDWGEPRNLGDAINTEHFERFPSLSRDGRFLFFIRNVGNHYPSDDLHYYWVDAAILGEENNKQR